jgi:hypothetical protein
MLTVQSSPVQGVTFLGLKKCLGCVLYDYDSSEVFLTWWKMTDYGRRCLHGDDNYPNFDLINHRSVAWKVMYEEAEQATEKPSGFCQRCKKQLVHPNFNNISASAFSNHFKSALCQRGSADWQLPQKRIQATVQVSQINISVILVIVNVYISSGNLH